MMLGDYSDWGGWEYRDPWVAGLWHNPKRFGVPAWDGVSGGELYVFGEQGLGDEIFFASCLPEVMGRCRVRLETDARLIPVFERLGVECVAGEFVVRDGKRGRVQREPVGDWWIPFGDLPRILRHRTPFPDAPYLTGDPREKERFSGYRGRVGVSWRGAQGEYGWREFSAGIKDPLCLQYDPDWDCDLERPALDLKNDIEGLIGLLCNLERVVTVSTTVAHLSCALGIPTEVILAANGRNSNRLPWKWGRGGKTPWYRTATVYPSLSNRLSACSTR